MRIISGIFKGRRFSPPANFRARPTTDFAKENLFNVLNNLIDFENIECLDLFGGTGSISFELVSRGCKFVTCVEKDPNHAAFILKTGRDLGIKNLNIIKGDVFKWLSHCNHKFDFIFADPPYDLKNFKEVAKQVVESSLLNENGLFVLEHSKDYEFSHYPLFKEHRDYGSVNFSIFSY